MEAVGEAEGGNESRVQFKSLKVSLMWFVVRASVHIGNNFVVDSIICRSVYFIAAIMLQSKKDILKLDCDMPTVHAYLQNNIATIDVEPTCRFAAHLIERIPPPKLQLCVAALSTKGTSKGESKSEPADADSSGGGAKDGVDANAEDEDTLFQVFKTPQRIEECVLLFALSLLSSSVCLSGWLCGWLALPLLSSTHTAICGHGLV